jgi:hypothetical protein
MKKTLALALALALSACGGGEGADTTTTPAEVATTTAGGASATSTSAPSDPGPNGGQSMDELPSADAAIVAAAVDDLAERLAVATEAVELVEFERVTWNDGSLGCPQPGMMYTQALVDGSRTVLEVDGVTYDYHAGKDDKPFLCENPKLKPGSDPPATTPGYDY